VQIVDEKLIGNDNFVYHPQGMNSSAQKEGEEVDWQEIRSRMSSAFKEERIRGFPATQPAGFAAGERINRKLRIIVNADASM
jgi:hypothetical protein